jgi:hypothetical protein
MAGDWIKVEHALPDKPEVMEMAAMLGIDSDAVVGKLIRVWTWFDNHTEDGNAPVTVRALLDRYAGVTGFVASMLQVGWIRENDGMLSVTRFERHNGQTAKNRANTNRRVAKSRKCNGASVTSVTPAPLQKPLPEKRREDSKERERAGEKSPPGTPDLAEQAQAVVAAYPRKEKVADALAIVLGQLRAGDSFEAMLAGTKAAAAIIRTLPSGASNRYVPGAEAFFRAKRWADDPETLRRQGDTKSGSKPMSDEEALAQLGGRAVNTD